MPHRSFTACLVSLLVAWTFASGAAQEALAPGTARIHYHRPDGGYEGFELHVWEDTTASVTWADGLDPAGRTDFGVYWTIPLEEAAERVGFIVHRGDEKDPGPDMFLELATTGREAWVVSGSTSIHAERPDTRRASAGDLMRAQAHWVAPDLIAWRVPDVAGASFSLHASPGAELALTDDGIGGGAVIPLALDESGLPEDVVERFPHLVGYAALRLGAEPAAAAAELLRGQLAVAVHSAGERIDATGVQIPGVLDTIYADAATELRLGPVWEGDVPTLSVWAPTAQRVRLHRFEPGTQTPTVDDMHRDAATGAWSVRGAADWRGDEYLYEVTVYAPSTGRIESNLVTDPYSVALTQNSRRSRLVDLADRSLAPEGWAATPKPEIRKPEDIVIYELHIRDFSASDPSVPEAHRGKYLAFTHPDTHGMRHLRTLQQAGLTHLHLLPTFDIATIDEDPAARVEPEIEPVDVPSSTPEPQAAVAAVRDADAFNWGYDPYHFNAPEGSYATDASGDARIREFREMVLALNRAGLRVVADVVYNHTNSAGQAERSVLDRLVPGYYHRLDANGFITTSTCCPNTATEHAMMEKLMVDSVVLWATQYKIDAFRFDLMGHHMVRNMQAVRDALDSLTPSRDGIDGRAIYLYGEGWNFGEVADGARGVNATQHNVGGLGIGTFSDRLRDAVRGGGCCPSGLELFEQGFGNGLYWLPNGHERRSAEEAREALLLAADQIRVGLAGNLRDVTFEGREGIMVTGADVPYFGQPAGYALDPQEVVTYVSKHDNQTLFDINAYRLPAGTSMHDRVRMHQLGLSLVALAQGVPFFHAGSDLLRSKSLDRNSYDSGDWFNRLDVTYGSNNFGVGLPPASENREDWQHMRPLLENASLVPAPEDIERSNAVFREWLQIRASSELFRLPTAEEVLYRLEFHNTGPDQVPGLIAMTIADDVPGRPDLDPAHDAILVVVNATPKRQTVTVDGLQGADLRLHPVQRTSVDEALQTAAFYAPSGRATVPPLTTAVFVLPQ